MEAALETQDHFIDPHFFEQIAARSSEGILLLEATASDLPIVYVNSAFEALTGYPARDIVGKSWHVLARERGEHRGVDDLRRAAKNLEAIEVELPDRRKDGTVWIAHIALAPLTDARGKVRYLLVQQRPSPRRMGLGMPEAPPPRVDPARPRPDPAGFVARQDPVTGLPRYEHFEMLLNRDLAVARRDRRPVTLMLFEILELDVYRATFGAKAADSCVRMIGAQLSGTLRRAGDLCARLDDTLLVAAVLGQDEAEATQVADRIVANVRGLRLHNPRARLGRYVAVERALSGGVPGPEDDADSLLGRAKRLLAARLKEQAESYAAGPTESDSAEAGGS